MLSSVFLKVLNFSRKSPPKEKVDRIWKEKVEEERKELMK